MITPDLAVGRTTFAVVRHSGEPRASDASRSPSGTSRSTTSVARVTVGSIRTDSASAAANPENPWVLANRAKMNRPATIEGVPLIASTKIRTGRCRRPRTSFRYTAVITPSGTEISTAIPTCSKVPTIACRPPVWLVGESGPTSSIVVVKKATRMNWMPLRVT